jgi:hypothetical protein
MFVFKMSFKENLKYYMGTLFYFLISLIFFTLYFAFGNEVNGFFSLTLFLLLVVFPSIFHVKYFIFDNGSYLKLNYNDNYIIYGKKNKENKYLFSEIDIAVYYRRAKFGNDNISSLGIENYYYIDFKMKNGEIYRYTCLVVGDIYKLPFPVDFKKKLLPLP